jgi:hypothetical protein
MDDSTVRQMFRRYLCSPTKAPDVIKQQLHIIQRELNLLLADEFDKDSDDDSNSGKHLITQRVTKQMASKRKLFEYYKTFIQLYLTFMHM